MSRRLYISFLLLLVCMVQLSTMESCKPKGGDDAGGGGPTCTIAQMTPYIWKDPARFPTAVIPADNQMTEERIALGKQLFYDVRLSNNGESCNTCHVQEKGFYAVGLSDFDKGQVKMPLVNLAWRQNFMWNGRITGTLEDVMHAEITKRFNTDIGKINGIQDYKDKFCKYYGVNTITATDLAKPLAQFMRVLVSSNTKYDKYLLGLEPLNPNEMAGHDIFFTEKGDCFHCHQQVVVTDDLMHNNGLDSIYAKEIDKGYFNVTGNPQDLGKFRTPNLRNVALRSEFMHDGRFKTLMEVIEFYDHQVHRGVKTIDPVMLKPEKANGLKLTAEEKFQLVAFLNTLTDQDMIKNPAFKP